METCLNSYYILDQQLVHSCDFNPFRFENEDLIYEVIRVIDGKPLFLKEHLRRFFATLAHNAWSIRESEKQIRFMLKNLIESNRTDSGNIKLIAYSCNSVNQLKAAAWFIPVNYPSNQLYKEGVPLISMKMGRKQPNLKIQHSAYKNAIQQKLNDSGAYEVVLAADGVVTEGSKSNLFFIRDNRIFTAKDDQVLGGITRDKIVGICSDHRVSLIKDEIKLDQIDGFEASFLTGTSPKVLAINKIDEVRFDVTHPFITLLYEELNRIIKQDISDFEWDHA
jgi:branched-chain amino acid aminotransferase